MKLVSDTERTYLWTDRRGFFFILTVVWRDNFANNKNTKYDERWLSYCILDCFILIYLYEQRNLWHFFLWVLAWENEVIFFFAENAKLLSFGHCNTYFLCSKQSKRLYICKCRKCVTVLLNSTLIHSISSKERERNKISS